MRCATGQSPVEFSPKALGYVVAASTLQLDRPYVKAGLIDIVNFLDNYARNKSRAKALISSVSQQRAAGAANVNQTKRIGKANNWKDGPPPPPKMAKAPCSGLDHYWPRFAPACPHCGATRPSWKCSTCNLFTPNTEANCGSRKFQGCAGEKTNGSAVTTAQLMNLRDRVVANEQSVRLLKLPDVRACTPFGAQRVSDKRTQLADGLELWRDEMRACNLEEGIGDMYGRTDESERF